MYTEKVLLFIRKDKSVGFFGRDSAIEKHAKKIIGLTCETEEFEESETKTIQDSDLVGARLIINKNSNDTILNLPMRLIAHPPKSFYFPLRLETLNTEKSGVQLMNKVAEDKVIVFTIFYESDL